MRAICDVCGLEFQARNEYDKYCNECRLTMHKAVRPEEKPKQITKFNTKIVEQVREAMKLGLSYGQYMGRKK